VDNPRQRAADAEVTMWKLFAMALALSDTGSVSVALTTTNFASQADCQAAAQELFPKAMDQDVQGHHVSIRASAECRLDGGLPPPPIPMPFFPHHRKENDD
jgi:hypothetical protein